MLPLGCSCLCYGFGTTVSILLHRNYFIYVLLLYMFNFCLLLMCNIKHMVIIYICDGRMRSTTAGSVPMGHRVILYMLAVPRALLIALWLQVHTKGRKVRYKYSSAGTAWSL